MKIHEILWQIEQYSAGGNPENHSVTQRIEIYSKKINQLCRVDYKVLGIKLLEENKRNHES